MSISLGKYFIIYLFFFTDVYLYIRHNSIFYGELNSCSEFVFAVSALLLLSMTCKHEAVHTCLVLRFLSLLACDPLNPTLLLAAVWMVTVSSSAKVCACFPSENLW